MPTAIKAADWKKTVRRTMRIGPRVFMEVILSRPSAPRSSQGLDDKRVAEAIISVVPEPWKTTASQLTEPEVGKKVEEVNRRLTRDIPPEILSDAQWSLAELEYGNWPGDYVAILNQKVVGSGDDETELREQLSKKLNVPPERFVIEYKGAWL